MQFARIIHLDVESRLDIYAHFSSVSEKFERNVGSLAREVNFKESSSSQLRYDLDDSRELQKSVAAR